MQKVNTELSADVDYSSILPSVNEINVSGGFKDVVEIHFSEQIEKQCSKSSFPLKTLVKDDLNNPQNVIAYNSKKDAWSEDYILLCREKYLGCISLSKIEPKDSSGYIFIQSMANESIGWKGVGRALHELAIRKSIEYGFEGRVQLVSVKGSSAFHFICGYRTDPLFNIPIDSEKTIDDQIAEAIAIAKTKNMRADTSHLDLNMYLPDTSITVWRQRLGL